MSKADASVADSSATLGLDDTRGNANEVDTMWSELESGRLIASSSGLRGVTAESGKGKVRARPFFASRRERPSDSSCF